MRTDEVDVGDGHAEGHVDGRSRLVAVVDDDTAVRVAMEDLLEASGMRCAAFGSAEEFLAVLPDLRPDCLVLDLQLPGLNGLQLQRELAARGLELPLIFLSSHDQPLWHRMAMEGGARAYLVKPADAQQVLTSLRLCLC